MVCVNIYSYEWSNSYWCELCETEVSEVFNKIKQNGQVSDADFP